MHIVNFCSNYKTKFLCRLCYQCNKKTLVDVISVPLDFIIRSIAIYLLNYKLQYEPLLLNTNAIKAKAK